jgi:hypothetical protein
VPFGNLKAVPFGNLKAVPFKDELNEGFLGKTAECGRRPRFVIGERKMIGLLALFPVDYVYFSPSYFVGWGTLALINAGLAQARRKADCCGSCFRSCWGRSPLC